ncbi:MAG: hypothetical protein ACXW3F_10825, partial [Pyrinomonadaceae bacterium]
ANAKIQEGLDRALESYNKGVGSLEARVMVTARKFKERGAIAGEEIEIIDSVDKTSRVLTLDEGGLFPELVAGEPDPDPDDDETMPLLRSSKTAGGQG